MPGGSEQHQDGRPIVSVVIPTCNRSEVLARCLHALTLQTYSDYEIIVVDDCSSDDTPRVLERFGIRHPKLRFRSLRNEHHGGANPSRNRGIHESKGDYICLIDCDSIARPDWLERLLARFDSPRVAAVTGMVEDPPATNLYELTLKGLHRVHGKTQANRLIAGNMCIRRGPLFECRLDEDRPAQPMTKDGTPDVTVSGRGDEEGLFLRLRAAGYEVRTAHDAVVLHDHPFSRRSFFRQAFRGGRSAAHLVYKYYLPQRLDMLPFILTYATLPLALIHGSFLGVSLFFLMGALVAIIYNDLFRKKKTPIETIITFPMLLIYYHVRLAGYILETVRLRCTRHETTRIRLC